MATGQRPPLRVGLIGFGGLGSQVATHLVRDPAVRLVAVAAREHQAGRVRSIVGDVPRVEGPAALLAQTPQVVVECASHEAFRAYAVPVLAAGVPLIAVSVGVLAEEALRDQVLATARGAGTWLRVPPGAIGAIDAIAAARHAGLHRVLYVTRKTPRVWRGTPAETMIDLDAVREPQCFFDDTAERAALLFPEKANVTATLALAGVGFRETRVRFWADPGVSKSVHRIEAEGATGTLVIDLANEVAPSNDKSSWLTAMSIVQAVANCHAALRL